MRQVLANHSGWNRRINQRYNTAEHRRRFHDSTDDGMTELRREEEEDPDEIREGGGARSFRYRLELAKAFPAQEVDAAAIMDRLSFGGDPRDPLVGAVDDRGLPTPVANVAALKRRYAFTPDLGGVRKLALERPRCSA